MQERRLLRIVYNEYFKKQLMKFLQSKKALAIPVTYLILFVSLVAIISITYSFAVVKVSSRGGLLKVSVAKQNMQVLNDAVRSVAWSFGASEIVYMDDCGGVFQTKSTVKSLVINFADDVVFNSSIGKAFYELESSEFTYDDLFIKGDYGAIINQSAYTMTQLYFSAGNEAKELTLCYRPSVTATPIGTSNGKPLNLIRVYIINLNSSQNLMLREKFYLKVTSLNVTTTTQQYDFSASISSLALKAVFGGILSTVRLPISSNSEGAVVNLEIVMCNVKIQRVEV